MFSQSRYIDPTTRGYITEDGNHKRTSAALSWAYLALFTKRGSIENLPNFGSRIYDICTHNYVGITRDIEAAAREVLQPEVGRRFRAYQTDCWLENGAPLLQVTIISEDGEEIFEVPFGAG